MVEDAITRARRDINRLATLRAAGLLDSPPEEAFDRLTRLAVRLIRVPASFVSLVDEFRDFYKSHCGFGEPLATIRELEGTTFCHYAITSDGPLVIPDTRADPVFRHVPTVESLGVAAYVGVPIRTSSGHVLGSFCAIDFVPRAWTEDEIEVLTELARSAEREIQLREAVREHEAQAEEARAAAEQLRESEERFRQIAETVHEVFYVSEAEPFRLLYVSPAYEEVWGRGVEDLFRDPQSFLQAILPEDRGPVVDALERQRRGEETETGYRVLRPDGSLRWILDRAYPVRDESGSLRIVGIAEDVTSDKLAEQAVRESEERYRLATRVARDVIWDWSVSTGQVVWSEALRSTFGYAPEPHGGDIEAAIGWWSGCIHPEDRERVVEHFQRAVDAGEETWSEEYRFRRADGTYAAVIDRGHIARNAAGEPVRMIGSMVDITETKRTEAALRRHVEQLRELARAAVAVHSAPSVRDALQVITDKARDVIGAHQAITSILRPDGESQTIDAVSFSDKYAAWRDYDVPVDGSGIYRLVVANNRAMRMTQEQLEAHPDWHGFGAEAGRHPPMRGWLAVPLLGRDGRSLGLIQLSDRYEGEFTEADEAMLIQLAQLGSIAIENTRLYMEAVEANQAKSDFLATMSHELRTPLNAMIGYTDLLEMGIPEPIGARAQAQIARVGLSARHLLQLIEEILTFSRLEAGREEPRREWVDPRDLVREVCAIIEPLSREKGLRFDVHTSPDLGAIETDPRKVRQILINLLGNAVKFTDSGSVAFTASREGDEVVFRVRDTGIGIAPEYLEQIFEPFLQVESGKTRRAGGTGLGLSVTRRLSRLLGGDVFVESTPGRGSVFTVVLPSRREAARAASEAHEAA